MSNERILELIEKQDKYYVLGFINGIIAHRDELLKENEELKRQLEDTIEELELVRCDLHNRTSERDGAEKQNDLYEFQQEFIKYLENLLTIKKQKANTVRAYQRTVIPIQEILTKYKEIIGVKDE